jgi:hypothetical protein
MKQSRKKDKQYQLVINQIAIEWILPPKKANLFDQNRGFYGKKGLSGPSVRDDI